MLNNNTLLIVLSLLVLFPVLTNASSDMKLTFNKKTGQWTGLHADKRNLISKPSDDVSIFWNGGQLPPSSQWKLVSIKQNASGAAIVRHAGDWEIKTEFTIKDKEIFRKASFKWLGKDKVKVNGTALTLPDLRLSDNPDDYYLLPSSFPVKKHKYSSLKPEAISGENWWIHGEYSLAVVHSAKTKTSVIAGYTFTMDETGIVVTENKNSVDISHRFNTSALLKPGAQIDCGVQIIRFINGNEDKLKQSLADFSNSINNGPPADRAEYLKKTVIYEAHPWGRLEMWTNPDRNNRYSRLTSLLPYYDKLGISTLWILPVSWPPPWVYTLPAFDRIDPQNGTPEELKALIDSAHSKDMKVLIDLVVYGINPSSEEVKKLPADCWCYNEKGNRAIVWGGAVLAADCSNPTWQKRISEVVTHWARDFGFDGTRLDVVGWGQVENWNNPMRMNASIAYGGSQLNKIIRDSFRAYDKNAATLPEGAKPLVFRNADMVFGYPLYMKLREMTTNPDLAEWISDIKNWLEYERLCYPTKAEPGIVRFLENHDTVSPSQYFGQGPSQALMALLTFVQGIPMLYQEQETGFTQDLTSWLKLRRSEKCFYDGEASYTSIKCSNPNVMCFLRKSSSDAAVVAINFTENDIECSLSWPKDINLAFPSVFEAFSGKQINCTNSTKVHIPAYRPTVLLLKKNGSLPAVKSYDIVDQNKTLKAVPANQGEIQIKDGKRWFVESSEGYIEDDFNPLNVNLLPNESVVDALPMLRRAWSPVTGGIMDGASRVSMGVESQDGKIIRVEFDPNKVEDAKIVDPAADGKEVKLLVTAKPDTDTQDNRYISKWIKITPQFVYLKTGSGTLALARRHGGIPVEFKLNGSNVINRASTIDLYTDNGIFANREYVSADGETNPRMQIKTDKNSSTVTFTGMLRSRAWNTVAPCGIAGPVTKYTINYTANGSGEVVVKIGIVPSTDLPSTGMFYALRLPVADIKKWEAVRGNGTEGDKTQGRLTESRTNKAKAFKIAAGQNLLTVDSFSSFQNVFLTTDNALYLALMDGQTSLKAGQEISAEVRLSIKPIR